MASDRESLLDNYFKVIGMLVVAHTDLEGAMKAFANIMINQHEKTGEILTADLPFQPLKDKLVSLYCHFESDPEKSSRFRKLIEKASDLTGRRNEIIHSRWLLGPHSASKAAPIRLKATARMRGYRLEAERVELDGVKGIRTLIREIDATAMEIMETRAYWESDHPNRNK